MNELLTTTNDLITREISESLISFRSNKITNTLLDGTYHVQSIGTPLKVIDITCVVNENGKSIIDAAHNEDRPIKLNWYGKYYIGIMDATTPKWSYFVKGPQNKRMYSASFTLIVDQEGSL